MKTLLQVILEKEQDNDDDKVRAGLKFIIYKEDGTTVDWLKDDEPYQKIECLYEENPDFGDGVKIDFLLGKDDNDKWSLWAGKPGVVDYSDEPYKDLKVSSLSDAIAKGLDEMQKFISKVKEEPNNWVQYYV